MIKKTSLIVNKEMLRRKTREIFLISKFLVTSDDNYEAESLVLKVEI